MNNYTEYITKKIFVKPDYNLSGMCSQEDFLAIYNKEIKRSYRTDVPLTLITIKIDPVAEMKLKYKNTIYHDLLNNLIRIINSFLREEDVTHLNANSIINILLVDTSLEDAQIVKKKITQQLLAFYNSSNNGDFKNLLSRIKFSLIPLNMIAGNDKIEATPVYKIENEFQDDFHLNSDDSSYNSNLFFDLKRTPTELGIKALNIPVSSSRPQSFSKILKRIFDIFTSLFGMLLFSPMFIIIATAIKLSSKGPIFYRQERLGEFGIPFLLYKFRTMKIDSDDSTHREYVTKMISGNDSEINHGTSDNPLFKLKKDKRITKVGSILRKTSIDEVPQLLNILRGEMSLVGPRPPIPYEVEAYKNWHLQRILEAKPGLTGLWQTSGKNKTTFEEMVRLDLRYIKKRSTWLDMKIVFNTLPAMLNKEV